MSRADCCPTCGKPRDLVRQCECGATFTVQEAEARWYGLRGLSVPTHCKACRDARRSQNQTPARRATQETRNERTNGF